MPSNTGSTSGTTKGGKAKEQRRSDRLNPNSNNSAKPPSTTTRGPHTATNTTDDQPPTTPEPSADLDSVQETPDSSSSSDIEMPAENNNITICDGVEIPKINGLPRVTKMTLNPQVVRDFEDYANLHFAVHGKKDLTEKRKMKLIAGCFASKEVMNWIISEADNQDDTVTFSNFVDKLRDHFLDSNWEVNVQRELLSEMMPKDIKYTDWAARVKKKNDVLKNTEFHLSNTSLREFLQNHLCRELTEAVYSADGPGPEKIKLHKVTDLGTWEQGVRLLDEQRLQRRRMVREELEEERSRSAKLVKGKSKESSSLNNNKKTFEKKATQSGETAHEDRCPRLTDEERKILSKYWGCTKCRKCLVDHDSKACPNDWPIAAGYQEVKRPSKEAVDAFFRAKNNGEGGSGQRDQKGKAPAKQGSHPNKRTKRDTAGAVVGSEDKNDIIAAMNEAGDTTPEASDDE